MQMNNTTGNVLHCSNNSDWIRENTTFLVSDYLSFHYLFLLADQFFIL